MREPWEEFADKKPWELYKEQQTAGGYDWRYLLQLHPEAIPPLIPQEPGPQPTTPESDQWGTPLELRDPKYFGPLPPHGGRVENLRNLPHYAGDMPVSDATAMTHPPETPAAQYGRKAVEVGKAVASGVPPISWANNLVEAIKSSYGAEARGEHDIPSLLSIASLGSGAPGGPGALARPDADTLRIFGGMKAKTAPQLKQLQARQMESRQEDPKREWSRREIYDKTGWYKDVDDKWKFYISDSNTKFAATDAHKLSGVTLNSVLRAPDLFAAYPQLRNITYKRGDLGPGVRASFFPMFNMIATSNKLDIDETYKSLIHELQHAVQEIEGFAKGTNETAAGSWENYRKTAGEVEARHASKWAYGQQQFNQALRAAQQAGVPPQTLEEMIRTHNENRYPWNDRDVPSMEILLTPPYNTNP